MSILPADSKILIIDDEPSIRQTLSILLRRAGYTVSTAAGVKQAIESLRTVPSQFPVVITDLAMPDGSGMDVLAAAQARCEFSQCIMLTAHSTVENAVEAMKLGAYDFLAKPFDKKELLAIISKAFEKYSLLAENRSLRSLVKNEHRDLVARSSTMRSVLDQVDRIAPTRSSVLLTGESGTGKERIAQLIHESSPRKDAPFLVVNCGAIPENLMESELFGYEKGAFTGAHQKSLGMFREADGGTLFLDEIGELPLTLQVKLLRALQERKVRPVGGAKEVAADVRVLAATNRKIEEEVQAGAFRQDLYYRINVFRLILPPLRERRDDIPELVQRFLERFSVEMGKLVTGYTPDALRALVAYEFPGNVRELENFVERAVALAQSTRVGLGDLPPELSGLASAPSPQLTTLPASGCQLDEVLTEVERRLMLEALEQTGGVRTKAAQLLGISFRSLRYRLQKHDFEEPDSSSEQPESQ
ncbi:MAG: sigma-54 dependent transcriptional regulator [Polyangiaceae bacterium]|nr:sigma-54 dependent transcriptional regulator [Polyangiaceae bacterium]